MEPLKLKVIIGSVRDNRFAEIPAAWIAGMLKVREGVEVEVLDLKDYPMPFFYEALPPSMRAEGVLPSDPVAAKWALKIAEADGYVVIAPEYNHGYPAVLKNAFDWIKREWHEKAIGFVSYGSAVGARSVEQLREVAIELQMAPIRNAVHLPWAATEEARKDPQTLNNFAKPADAMIDQLIWWTRALKSARTNI